MTENDFTEAPAAEPQGIDPDYIDGIRFATAATQGYTMREVDEFLDTVSAQGRVTLAREAATAEHNEALVSHVAQLEAHAQELTAHFEREFEAQAIKAQEGLEAQNAELAAAHARIAELEAAGASGSTAQNDFPTEDSRVAQLQAEVGRLEEELLRAREAQAEAEAAASAFPAFAAAEPQATPAPAAPVTISDATRAAERLMEEAGHVAAQLSGEARETLEAAERDAQAIREAAEVEGENIQANAKTGVADLQARIDELEARRLAAVEHLRDFYQSHLNELAIPMDPESAMYPAPEADTASDVEDLTDEAEPLPLEAEPQVEAAEEVEVVVEGDSAEDSQEK